MSIDKKYILTGLVASSIMLHTGMTTAFADTEYRVITLYSVSAKAVVIPVCNIIDDATNPVKMYFLSILINVL